MITKNSPYRTTGDEQILSLTSKLRIPKPVITKPDAWEKISETIENRNSKTRTVYSFTVANIYFPAIAAIFVIGFIFAAAWYFFSYETIYTKKGQTFFTEITDKIHVNLNGKSELTYSNPDRVKLNGEAFFRIHSGTRFVVEAGNNIKITVTGTKFNVYSRGEITEVACYEGSLSILYKNKMDIKLVAGQFFSNESGLAETLKMDETGDLEPTWIKGSYYYRNARLTRVFADIEAVFGIEIIYRGNPSVTRRYTGYFKASMPDEALKMVCIPMQLGYKISADTTQVEIFEIKN